MRGDRDRGFTIKIGEEGDREFSMGVLLTKRRGKKLNFLLTKK
jgi:hypothetical protein